MAAQDVPAQTRKADEQGRAETDIERLDRNWAELLQELRVAQTGVQLLTGFLLTLPFQQRFTTLGPGARAVYLVTVVLAAGATVALVAPVSLHRLTFRQHERAVLVHYAHGMSLVGLFLLALAMAGVLLLLFRVVIAWWAGGVAAGVVLVLFAVLWVAVPVRLRRQRGR
ncbi:MAG: hypothetical protein JWM48_1281 [Mycobacterium sp.]|nr:hypothetical protein [Mycobacterium sp.]